MPALADDTRRGRRGGAELRPGEHSTRAIPGCCIHTYTVAICTGHTHIGILTAHCTALHSTGTSIGGKNSPAHPPFGGPRRCSPIMAPRADPPPSLARPASCTSLPPDPQSPTSTTPAKLRRSIRNRVPLARRSILPIHRCIHRPPPPSSAPSFPFFPPSSRVFLLALIPRFLGFRGSVHGLELTCP